MRLKRQKTTKKHTELYQSVFGFRKPFQVIVDVTFLEVCRAGGLDYADGLSRLLGGQVHIMTTYCCYAEARKMALRPTAAEAKRCERRRCVHDPAIDAAACIRSIVCQALDSGKVESKKKRLHKAAGQKDSNGVRENQEGSIQAPKEQKNLVDVKKEQNSVVDVENEQKNDIDFAKNEKEPQIDVVAIKKQIGEVYPSNPEKSEVHLSNTHNYCVATNDQGLRAILRTVPGVPLIYINKNNVMILEPPSRETAKRIASIELSKTQPLAFEQSLCVRQDEIPVTKRRRKEPNSLSQKKKLVTAECASVSVPVDGKKRRRRR